MDVVGYFDYRLNHVSSLAIHVLEKADLNLEIAFSLIFCRVNLYFLDLHE